MRQYRRSPHSPQPRTAPGSDARIDVGRHEARELWQLVDEVASRTSGPDVGTLALDGSLTVSFAQSRARGGLARGERTVTIGAPLLEALPPSEVRALLTSELAATVGRHVRRRVQVGDGDNAAAETSGTVVLAAALVRAELVRRVLDEDYWPAVFHGAHSSAHPQVKPFSSVRRTLRAHVEAGALRTQAARLLGVDADENDVHATLMERLRALGVSPLDAVDAALIPVGAAAADLLGGAYQSLLARLDERWREQVDEWWEEAHRDALQQALGAEATPARTWTQATALASYRETLERTPTRT